MWVDILDMAKSKGLNLFDVLKMVEHRGSILITKNISNVCPPDKMIDTISETEHIVGSMIDTIYQFSREVK